MTFITQYKSKSYALYNNVRIIMLFHLLFCYNHGFIECSSNIAKFVVKLFCFLIAISCSIIILYDVNNLSIRVKVWHYFCSIEFLAVVLITLIMKNNVASFCKMFSEIDEKLKITKKDYLFMHLRTYPALIITTVSRLLHCFYYCAWYPDNCLPFYYARIVSYYPLLAMDFMRILVLFVNFIIYYRLRLLRKVVEAKYLKNKSPCWIQKSDVKYHITVIQDIYKKIADNVSFYKPTSDALVSIFLM